MEEIWSAGQHLEFSYTRVMKHLYSEDKAVRLLAGAALATFAYNNMSQQQIIAAEGGVKFSCFEKFLQSEEEYLRCNAAFQVKKSYTRPVVQRKVKSSIIQFACIWIFQAAN